MKKLMIRSKYGKIVSNSVEDRDIDNGCDRYLETKEKNIIKRGMYKNSLNRGGSSSGFPINITLERAAPT